MEYTQVEDPNPFLLVNMKELEGKDIEKIRCGLDTIFFLSKQGNLFAMGSSNEVGLSSPLLSHTHTLSLFTKRGSCFNLALGSIAVAPRPFPPNGTHRVPAKCALLSVLASLSLLLLLHSF